MYESQPLYARLCLEVGRGCEGGGGGTSTLMPALFRAEDAIGTIHYSRFTVLSEKTLLFLGDFDGEFSQLMADLGKHAGPVFEAIFRHVDDPQADGAPAIKITGFSNFVTTKAAAYCFLLSITAIKFIAKLG